MERFVVLVELIVLELKLVVVVVEVIVVVVVAVVALLIASFCNHTTARNCHNMFAILPNVVLSLCVYLCFIVCVCVV